MELYSIFSLTHSFCPPGHYFVGLSMWLQELWFVHSQCCIVVPHHLNIPQFLFVSYTVYLDNFPLRTIMCMTSVTIFVHVIWKTHMCISVTQAPLGQDPRPRPRGSTKTLFIRQFMLFTPTCNELDIISIGLISYLVQN